MDLREYTQFKEKAESLRREADRNIGVLEEIVRRIQKEFNVKSIKEARRLAEALQKETQEAEAKYQQAKIEFEKTWGEKLQ